MARGIYSTTADAIYRSQGIPGVLKALRVKNANGCADILLWALQNNHIDVARQAYQKVSSATKWEMAKRLADSAQHHRAFPMVLGGQDPSFNNAELLWLAARSGNRDTVRFLVRHPKITAAMCVGKPNTGANAAQLVAEEVALWQRGQLQTVTHVHGMRSTARKM